jgi:metallo-beta-lactamase family protein
MDITFLGAADTVTGSRYLVRAGGRAVLVDCGLFQGLKRLRLRNWAPFPIDPAGIDAVVLTHAHLDHSGWLPRLVRNGFRGPAFCTAPTAELCALLLRDSAHLEEDAAARANRYGYTRHRPALPLYTRADAERALDRLVTVPLETETALPGFGSVLLRRAGHLLGAASVRLTVGGRRVVLSGDVGRSDDPVLHAPEPFDEADYVVIESTYGDRQHAAGDVRDALAAVVRRTAVRGGALVIPSFAVGRAQAVLHHLAELRCAARIPPVPIFLDSPMAADATRHFLAHRAEHRLTAQQCADMRSIVTITNSVEDSKAIDARIGPLIVISASGMATGGRVLHHLARFAPERRNTILLVGHQAAGTRGASLADGAPSIKLLGSYIDVAAEVVTLHGLSGHADAPGLIQWLSALRTAPRRTFVTHGEPQAADALRRRIHDELGWTAQVPEHGMRVALGRTLRRAAVPRRPIVFAADAGR